MGRKSLAGVGVFILGISVISACFHREGIVVEINILLTISVSGDAMSSTELFRHRDGKSPLLVALLVSMDFSTAFT